MSLSGVTRRFSSLLAATLNQNQELRIVLVGVYAWLKAVVIAAQRWRTLVLSAVTFFFLIKNSKIK
jgi:hypothetical protein